MAFSDDGLLVQPIAFLFAVGCLHGSAGSTIVVEMLAEEALVGEVVIEVVVSCTSFCVRSHPLWFSYGGSL